MADSMQSKFVHWSAATLHVAIDTCSPVRMDGAEANPIGVFWSTHGVAASWARNWASPPLSWHSCWPKKEDVVVEVAEKVISDKKAEQTTMSASRRERVKKNMSVVCSSCSGKCFRRPMTSEIIVV